MCFKRHKLSNRIHQVLIKSVILIVFLLCTENIHGQEYYYEKYDTKEIGSESMSKVIQDKEGTLWFCSYNGLFSFEGKEFTGYKNGLSHAELSDAVITRDGRFFVLAASDGLHEFTGKAFIPVSGVDRNTEELYMQVNEISEGVLHILTTERFIEYNYIKNEIAKEFDGFRYARRFEYFNGKIWIADMNDGIVVIDSEKNTVKKITPFSESNFYCINKDKLGNVWIGGNRVVLKMSGQEKIEAYYRSPDNASLRIIDILPTKDNTLLLSTFEKGIYSLNPDKRPAKLNPGVDIFDLVYADIFKDSEENYWLLPVTGSSLVKLRLNIYKHPLKPQAYTFKLNLKNDSTLLCINAKKGLEEINLGNGEIDTLPVSKTVEPRITTFYDYCYLKNKETLVATDAGIFVAKDSLYAYTDNRNTDADIFHLLPVNNDKSAIAFGTTSKQGFVLNINPKKEMKKYKDYRPRIYMFADSIDVGTYFYIDRKGWYVHKFFTPDPDQEEHLVKKSTSVTIPIKISDRKYLYVQSDTIGIGELYKTSAKTDWKVKETALKNERLPLKNLGFSAIDSSDNIWAVNRSSIYKIRIDSLKGQVNVTHRYRLHEKNANIKTEKIVDVLKEKNKLFITTDKELIIWELTEKMTALPPEIKHVDLPEGIKNDTINASGIPYDIELPYNKSHLTLHFSSNEFFLPASIDYSYKLVSESLSAQSWSAPTTKTSLDFSFLAPGNYTLLLRATDRFGRWSEGHTEYTFSVSPPFWKTPWFFTAVGGAILLALYTLHQIRVNYLKKINRVQQKYSHRLIEAQEDERKRVARELHDGVGQSLVLLKNEGSTPEYESKIDLLIDDVQRISNNLHPEYIRRLGLTKAIKYLLKNMDEVSYTYFRCEIDDDIDHHYEGERALHIYRIVQECVNNIIKHADAPDAWICLKIKNQRLKIWIADNGKGMKANPLTLNKVNSLGLKSIEERIFLLGGTYKMKRKGEKGGFEILCKIPL
ncbi:ATP-binding protein [Sinomicrobium sp. M5D2P17]